MKPLQKRKTPINWDKAFSEDDIEEFENSIPNYLLQPEHGFQRRNWITAQRWRSANKARIHSNWKRWYEANREAALAYQRWFWNQPEKREARRLRQQAKYMKRRGIESLSRPIVHWTNIQKAFLAVAYGRIATKQIAKVLNRTEQAISSYATNHEIQWPSRETGGIH